MVASFVLTKLLLAISRLNPLNFVLIFSFSVRAIPPPMVPFLHQVLWFTARL